MERSLFDRAVKLHGLKLDYMVKEEQGASFLGLDANKPAEDVKSALNDENAAKSKELSTSAKHKNERKRSRDETTGHCFTNKLHGFIARKADLLFRQQSDDEDAIDDNIPSAKDAEESDYYAILPPLEQFLEVDPDVSQERLFDILKVGDVVIGQILSTKEFGIFVKLLALCQGTSRFLDESEVVALLPAGELRDKFSHVAAIDDFQIGDLLRALVIKVNSDEQKVIISLHTKDNSPDNGNLGLITESDLPVHYRRSVLQMDTQELYEDMLHNSVGFDNPFNVAYLGTQLRLKDTCPLSLMRGLQRSNYPEKEYAEPLRKWQTNRWSLESVAKGVEHFKAGRLLDAMQHLNKALEIDEENVEALVARGALYANKDLLSKALQDFGKALKINPNHRNANKYMCQTLVERGKQHEEAGEIEKAADCYQTAVDIKPDFPEAQLCLNSVNKTRTPSKNVASSESITSPSPNSPDVKLSVEALRQLVDPENDVSRSARKSTVKTKKKKKKERETDEFSRKRDKDDKQGRSRDRNYKRKKSYSSSKSSETSRSRSRSRHRSSKKDSRDGRKSSRKSKKGARRLSHRSVSYSRSSSSDRSRSQSLRSRSRQLSGRKTSKHTKKRKSRRSSSISRSSSTSGSQSSHYRSRSRSKNRTLNKASRKHRKSSSKRQSEVKCPSRHSVSRSRSCSPYTVSENTSSPQRSKSRSLDRSRKKRTEEQGSRSSRKVSKTTVRSQSHSLSPGTRHRTLSGGSQESRRSKMDSLNIHDGAGGRSITKLDVGVRETKQEKSQSKSKSDSRQLYTRQDKNKTPAMNCPSLRREQDVQDVSDDNQAALKKSPSNKHLKKGASLHPSSDRSKKGPQSSHGAKSNDGRGDRKSPNRRDHNRRSRSRSFSSDESYSGTSYSSYSVSGSRSYSYSSYSSSGSDDNLKESRRKSDKSNNYSKQSKKPSKTSEVQEDRSRDEPGGDEEDSSDSDVDTGIYEISRDHLEMYMDSKTYQLTKEDDVSPLKRKKRLRSDEDEVPSDKKIKSGKRRRKDTFDNDKEEKTISILAGKKELQWISTQETVTPLKSDSKLPVNAPPLPPPTRTAATVNSLKEKPSSHESGVLSTAPTDKVLELNVHVVHRQSLAPNVNISPSTARNIGLDQSVINRNQKDVEQPVVLDRVPHRVGRTDMTCEEQHAVSGNQQSSISVPQNHRSGSSAVSRPDKEEAPYGTSTKRAYRVEPSKLFTSDQLSVIDSFSKQLVKTRQASSQAVTSGKPVDPNAAQYYQRHERDQDQGSSQETNPLQGQQIGVITTHRPSDTFRESDNHQGKFDGTDPFNDRHAINRSRWDVKITEDRGFDSRLLGGSEFSFAASKPTPVSIDYQHRKEISSSVDNEPKDYRERGVFVSGLPRSRERHIGTHGMDYMEDSVLKVEKQIKELREHSRHKTENEPSHRGHHSNVDSNRSATKVQVVDYQHGKSDRYHERQRSVSDEKRLDDRYERRRHGRHLDRNSDRQNETHPGDHYRSSPERHHRHRSPRGSNEHKLGDRRRYHDRDRHGHTHGDRHHSRSSGRIQRSATPVEPKESNPFLQLVSSSKDMQVASLHSEGKWGHDSSPENKKSSSWSRSRSWWL